MSTAAFTCDLCGGTFEKAWSEEEAQAEAERLFSPAELEDTAIVCHDCWLSLMDATPRIRAEVAREAAAAGMSFDDYVRYLAQQDTQ